jgi:hypothetical protein
VTEERPVQLGGVYLITTVVVTAGGRRQLHIAELALERGFTPTATTSAAWLGADR